ncbi:MAG TPA: GAP family protein [Solirubrobacterales bacterium]|nr:GAP family protein [Solirubrobacterales bacterium]
MNRTFFFAFTAALNPTLLGATTVMLLLDHPKRLLLGYLLGALMTSVTLGMVIVFALDGSSSATSTAKTTLSPAMDLALGTILLMVALAIRPGREPRADGRLAERRRRRTEAKKAKGAPRWQRALSEGTSRTTFVVGALLTLPGASYLIGLSHIADADASTVATVGMILAFNAIMLILLEAPLAAYTIAPEWTPQAVDRFKSWFNANSRKLGFRLAAGIGVLLIVKGLIELL